MRQLTHGSLFAGIGGFDLGFERAGIETVWQVEIDPFCQKVLAKYWPEVPRFDDVRTFGQHGWLGLDCDIISGGFPCQPHSSAGRRSGKDDPRWLWPDFKRILGSLRPRFAVVENVPGLFTTAFADVVGGLASIGYDAEWHVVSASDLGAKHQRERVWLLAYPECPRESQSPRTEQEEWRRPLHGSKAMEYATSERLPDWTGAQVGQPSPLTEFERPSGREIERDFRGVAYGVSNRVDRLRALGNSIVPQIAEWIGRRIVEACE